MVENAPEPTRVKASLRRLAGSSEREVIGRASEATERLDDAAQFVETVGLEQLEAAIEATDDPDVEATGREALEAFCRFRRAATGDAVGTGSSSVTAPDYFHRGHGTDLSGAGEGPDQ